MNYIAIYWAVKTDERIEFDTETDDFDKACNRKPKQHLMFLYWKQTPFYRKPEVDENGFIDFHDTKPPQNIAIWLLRKDKHVNMVVWLESPEELGKYISDQRQPGFYECDIDRYGNENVKLNRSRPWSNGGGKWKLVRES